MSTNSLPRYVMAMSLFFANQSASRHRIYDTNYCAKTENPYGMNVSSSNPAGEGLFGNEFDVAFVAFSPSGRVSKFSNQKRIDDVINRYVNLPASERLSHIVNVQGKMEKLKQLSHIKADSSKLHFLDKQVENLELQIKKCGLELQILEADIRDYEVGPEHDTASLHQLTWCERNLTHSLEKVLARKDALLSSQYKQPVQGDMESQEGIHFSCGYNGNKLAPEHPTGENPGNLDSWINPYGINGHHQSMFQDIYAPKVNHGPSNMNILESGITIPSDIHTSLDQQSYVVDEEFLQFQQQLNANAWNNFTSMTSFPDANRMSSQTRVNSQPPSKFTSSTTMTTEKTPFFDEMENFLQFTESNSNSNSNMEESLTRLTCGSTSNVNFGQQDKGKGKDTFFDNLQLPETSGANMASTSNKHGIERQRSLSWDWENLLLDESFNFVERPK